MFNNSASPGVLTSVILNSLMSIISRHNNTGQFNSILETEAFGIVFAMTRRTKRGGLIVLQISLVLANTRGTKDGGFFVLQLSLVS